MVVLVMLPAKTLLTILSLPRVGRKTAWQVAKQLSNVPSDAAGLCEEFRRLSKSIRRLPSLKVEAAEAAASIAESIMDDAAKEAVTVVVAGEPLFPSRLLSIPDPPLVLFVKGNVACLRDLHSVAVIGTRYPSEAGRIAARRLGEGLARRSITVISGLALGCDAEAHWGVVSAKGKGVAVLAHGLHTVSPASNKDLACKLLEYEGCLVSEYPCGEDARKQYFVERDRLQSGLSDGVVLVEAAEKSGSMHTVGFAEHQGRPIAAIAFTAGNDNADGNDALLRTGRATPIGDMASLDHWIRTRVEPVERAGNHDETEREGRANTGLGATQGELPF